MEAGLQGRRHRGAQTEADHSEKDGARDARCPEGQDNPAEAEASLVGRAEDKVPVRPANELEVGPHRHQKERAARQDKSKAAALQEVPKEACRFDVAGGHLPIPHQRHRKGLCDRFYGRPLEVPGLLEGIPAQEQEGIDKRVAACPRKRKDPEGNLSRQWKAVHRPRLQGRSCGIWNQTHLWQAGPSEGQGKIESYHKALYRELVCQTRFKSLSHFRRELRKFDRKYNHWRKQEVHGWQTPASIYNDERYFSKSCKKIPKKKKKSGQMLLQQKRT